ncbi:hypothetical protein DEH18_33525 [Streptomyces sp. NHF165]|nr:hypothetical protein DEH18_33525 [Streptomyces sp. NHF165]
MSAATVEPPVGEIRHMVAAEADECPRCHTRPRVAVGVAPEPPAGGGLPWLIIRGTCECPPSDSRTPHD